MSTSLLAVDGLHRLLAHPGVRTCLDALKRTGEETRLVGGCVRDALLGRDVADIDLATTLTPEAVLVQAKAAGLRAVPTGLAHGTVTLLVAGMPFEVTTLREDVETDGRHAVVRFGRDFALDAARRDFTLNALSLDEGGGLHDTVGGRGDLAAGRVRFIGDPATRIREDALRILRFFRFHARYGRGVPDAESLRATVVGRAGLDRLSRERVRAETLKLLLAPRSGATLAVMGGTGLLLRLLGGVEELGRFERVAAVETASAAQRLAALAVRTREDADRLCERLRLSGAEHRVLSDYAVALTAMRTRPHIDAPSLRALAARYGIENVRLAALALAGEPRPSVAEDAREALEGIREPVLPVTGADLVGCGLTPGPAIGRGLAAARERWLTLGCPEDEAGRVALIAHAVEAARAASP